MADKIIIEGEVVKRVREIVETLCPTSTFIKELADLAPQVIEVPKGVIAVSVGDNRRLYHVGVAPRLLGMAHRDFGAKIFEVLLPYSIFSVGISRAGTICKIYWHLVDSDKEVDFEEAVVVQNFFPNVGLNNEVCEGQAKIPHVKDRPLKHTLNVAIGTIIDSPCNNDLAYSDKFKRGIEDSISEWALNNATEEISKKLDNIHQTLLEIEQRDFTSMPKTEIDKVAKIRSKLVAERISLLGEKERLSSTFSWPSYILGYIQHWTTEHKDLINENPYKASQTMIADIGNNYRGKIRCDGLYGGRDEE